MTARIPLACGLSLPFYPMRPTHGVQCTETQLRADLARGDVLQPKLNGDRVELGVISEHGVNKVIVANRHMSLYKFKVQNAWKFQPLPVGTCLDGEVWKGNFYPFEALAIGSKLLINEPVERRIAEAKIVCSAIAVEWLFEQPTVGWVTAQLRAGMAKLKVLEGYVRKRKGSLYSIVGVERDHPDWTKIKWC